MNSSVKSKRKVKKEIFILQIDDRCFWREDERFPQYVLIETAVRMWAVAGNVVGGNIEDEEIDAIRIKNSEAFIRAAFVVADWIENGRLQLYDGESPLPISGDQRASIVRMLRANDPLSDCQIFNGRYLDGKKLYAAIDDLLPEAKRRSKDFPHVWWKLAREFAPPEAPPKETQTITKVRIMTSFPKISRQNWRAIFGAEKRNGLHEARLEKTTSRVEYDEQKFLRWLVNHRPAHYSISEAKAVLEGEKHHSFTSPAGEGFLYGKR